MLSIHRSSISQNDSILYSDQSLGHFFPEISAFAWAYLYRGGRFTRSRTCGFAGFGACHFLDLLIDLDNDLCGRRGST